MNFYELNIEDVFILSAVVNKIGMDNIKYCFENDNVRAEINAGSDNETVGKSVFYNILNILFDKLYKCENEIILLLSHLTLKSPDVIRKIKLNETSEFLYNLFFGEDLCNSETILNNSINILSSAGDYK